MLLRLTVSVRETRDTLKVAFNAGSSQQGKARRATVGCHVAVRHAGQQMKCMAIPRIV